MAGENQEKEEQGGATPLSSLESIVTSDESILLTIISFLTDVVLESEPPQHHQSIANNNAHDRRDVESAVDSDKSDASDIEQMNVSESDDESDEEQVDVEDGAAFDDWYERQYERQGDRILRQRRLGERRAARKQREENRLVKRKDALFEAKRKARDVVAMAGTCSSWRRVFYTKNTRIESLLWKPLFNSLFPDVDYQCVLQSQTTAQNIMGKSLFFSLFQLMVMVDKASLLNKSSKGGITPIPVDLRKQHLEGANLEDAIFVTIFEYQGKFSKVKYTSVAKLDDDEHIVKFHLPSFASMCYMKKGKWWKEAKSLCDSKQKKKRSFHDFARGSYWEESHCGGDDDSCSSSSDREDDLIWSKSAEESSSFPTADIFVALTNRSSGQSFTFFNIYHGKPKWSTTRHEAEEIGPEVCEDDICADIHGGSCLILGGNHVFFGYISPHGHYVDVEDEETEDEREELNEGDEVQNRLEDLKNFILSE